MQGARAMRIVQVAAAALVLGTSAAAVGFAPGVTVTILPAPLTEVSGLAHSRANRDVFWMHNDSGDLPRVYAVSRTGRLVGTYTLGGADAEDWEDMAIGPAPGGGSYLYLADIGDNFGQRPVIRVYRVLEPRVSPNQAPVRQTLPDAVPYDFVYDDGPRDAEAFMVDPLTGDFYVVSKRELDGNRLYRSASPKPGARNTLARAATLSFSGSTAADISADGLQVLIRRYSNSAVSPLTPPALAGSYWSRRDPSVSLVTLLSQPGEVIPLVVEAQGEAIAFDANGQGFYTTTEYGSLPGATNPRAPLTYYRRLPD